ncbi:hypothetical protein ISCGN_021619 [Ixodes scapularis]
MAKSPTKPAPKAFGTLGTGRILEPVYDRSAAAYIRDLSTLLVRRSLIPLAFSSMRRFFRRLVAVVFGVAEVFGVVGKLPPVPCGSNEIFKECYSQSCKEDTCVKKLTAETRCGVECIYGCACSAGFVRVGNDCVSPDKCVKAAK